MFFVFIYKRLSVCPHPLLLPLPQGEEEGIRTQCSYLNAYPRSPSRREGAIRKSYFLVKKHLIFSSIAEFILKIYRLLFLNANVLESAKAMRFVIQLFYQIDIFRHSSFVTTNLGFVLQFL